MDKLKNTIYRELEKYEGSGTLSKSDLEHVNLLTGALVNIDKLEMSGDYSNANSYGRHWVRGHYSRMADEMDHAMRNYSMSPEDRRTMERSRDILRSM